MIAGIDLSSFFVDVVFIDEEGFAEATWIRVGLGKTGDAFCRSRNVLREVKSHPSLVPALARCEAVGIEEPRGFNPGPAFRVQGAVLQTIPRATLVQPWVPSQWRKAVGLPGNTRKGDIMEFVKAKLGVVAVSWPQDACDAWCVAEATRLAIERS